MQKLAMVQPHGIIAAQAAEIQQLKAAVSVKDKAWHQLHYALSTQDHALQQLQSCVTNLRTDIAVKDSLIQQLQAQQRQHAMQSLEGLGRRIFEQSNNAWRHMQAAENSALQQLHDLQEEIAAGDGIIQQLHEESQLPVTQHPTAQPPNYDSYDSGQLACVIANKDRKLEYLRSAVADRDSQLHQLKSDMALQEQQLQAKYVEGRSLEVHVLKQHVDNLRHVESRMADAVQVTTFCCSHAVGAS